MSETCSVIECGMPGTHILAYRNPLQPSQIVREPVCEQCSIGLTDMAWVKKASGVLARNGADVPQPLPRIKVRAQLEGENGAYPKNSGAWAEEDAATMRDGRRVACVIEILDATGRVVDSSMNHPAPWWAINHYRRPLDVRTENLRYYATDLWTHAFGFRPGSLVKYAGLTLSVVALHQADAEHGDDGYATGWLICQYMNERTELVGVPVHLAREVRQLPAGPQQTPRAEFVNAVFYGPNFNGIED